VIHTFDSAKRLNVKCDRSSMPIIGTLEGAREFTIRSPSRRSIISSVNEKDRDK